MRSLKSLALFALLLSISLVVIADTSNDAKDQVKPSEATDVVEPQQRGGCRYGCCGSYAFGRCSACCSRPQAAEADANNAEVKAKDVVVEPQQMGFCRFGCCTWSFGRCNFCCPRPQAAEAVEAEAVEVNAIEPQQRGRGFGCRYGCCGPWRFGRCSYCCRSPQAEADKAVEAEAEVVEPQQRGGCRYGCCGSYAFGRCSACCSKKMAIEEEKKKP